MSWAPSWDASRRTTTWVSGAAKLIEHGASGTIEMWVHGARRLKCQHAKRSDLMSIADQLAGNPKGS